MHFAYICNIYDMHFEAVVLCIFQHRMIDNLECMCTLPGVFNSSLVYLSFFRLVQR